MAPELKPIEPKSSRWEPAADPSDIVVPGLDTTAPPYDQIEQIEQLITIKLQNIDANFAKMQHIMANRILPAVKRYAIGTQPAREAAKFWTTFYEQAAEIRIPTYEDYNTEQETQEDEESGSAAPDSEDGPSQSSAQPESDSDPEVETPHRSRMFNGDKTSSDVSFAPGQAAISSTPATVSRARALRSGHDSFASQASEPMPSWSASLESPIRQLNRDIQSLSDAHSVASSSVAEAYDASQDITQRPILPSATPKDRAPQSVGKGKGREGREPLLHDVLRKNTTTSTISSVAGLSSQTSPLKLKPRTPVIKTLNPYLPPDSNPSDWLGVVNLKNPNVLSPQKRAPSSPGRHMTFKPSNKPIFNFGRTRAETPPPEDDDTMDDNFGMSPPVMTDYARLPKLGRTPRKEAAERIMQGLVDLEQRRALPRSGAGSQQTTGIRDSKNGAKGYGTESSMSSMPTPPSMTRYNRSGYSVQMVNETSSSVTDASLDSMMRRVGLEIPEYTGQYKPPERAPAPSQPSKLEPPPTSSLPPRSPVFSVDPAASLAALRSLGSSKAQQQRPPPPPPQEPQAPRTPEPPQPQYDFYDDEVIGRGSADRMDDSLDSMDSFDYQDPDAPAAQFVFTEGDGDGFDDSFDSSIADDEELMMTDGTAGPLQQFMVAPIEDDGFDDDSFDNDDFGDGQTETVFGVPPGQRLQQQQLRMMGEDRMQDTVGLEQQFARAGWVQETPTPWNAHPRG